MANYAIIKTGGKQYRAVPGQQLTIEKIDGDRGAQVRFEQVLLARTDAGISVGEPTVDGAAVLATVVQQTRDNKVLIHKHKKRKKYRVTRGHRQYITRVLVDSIQVGGASAAPAAPPAPPAAAPTAPPPVEPAADSEE